MESEPLKGSINEHVTKRPDPKIDNQEEDGKPFQERKLQDFPSVSSSCSSALEFDIDEKGSFNDPSAMSGSVSSPPVTTKTPQGSLTSGSPPDGHELHLSPESQMKSPPVQTMVHPPGYDPNRIPASVFSTKATNPAEWSVTSNESLFSIHMGNNSFSRDHAILFGKSGEFPRLDDWDNPLSSLPPVMEVSAREECSVRSRKGSRIENEDSDNTLKVVAPAGADMKNHGKPQLPAAVTNTPHVRNGSSPRISTSNTRVSDVSGHSGSSFAFPVLLQIFTWIRFDELSYLDIRLLGDGGKSNSSLKVSTEKKHEKTEKPQIQAHISKSSHPKPKACEGKWFCWSCWPRCC
ncbi:hypothetical protein BUALT_Bualt04G0136000 [Buddleja alternifolia]|uniref:Uncharacterized protein n=1 Tax=Buddleja alternifolia TaxID=168488 RepID=A0AAV6XV50_9LAMI|nr:hypothetical protein BUALT_Bualt04G0136000 [Buddleja alternifolia]